MRAQVVATPAALAQALGNAQAQAAGSRKPPLDLGAVRFLVVDEVDACFQVCQG